ncbi:superkiller protein 3 [Crepidotus variabilis]|uniref:Superkiller protein 3 n=1 Tax=Crepidotus variabilis TaxID=179855 RepID=A0A9P6EII5_9AGAR|nr:superkiller protein 3 [Crepidotus variabilis]
MTTKVNLKNARECLSKKDYPGAKKYATQVLDFEQENYNAHVFLGLALLELREYDESEQVYRKATDLNPTQPLAWQGLSSFYEKREQWGKYAETLVRLAKLFDKSQDAVKCAENVQKLVALRRKQGSRPELVSALELYLPESDLYPLLSSLPPPDATNPTSSSTFEAEDSIHNGFRVLQEIVELVEAQEDEIFKKEAERRRTRLGAAGPEQIKREVFLEIASVSKLPTLYDAILNHPNTSDEARIEIETKQLRHKRRYLLAIPSTKEQLSLKHKVSKELDELVDAIVLLKKPDELGWRLHFESVDCEDTVSYDLDQIRDYIRLFPNTALATLFLGYYAYKQIALWDEDEEEAEIAIDDPADMILGSYADLQDWAISSRLVADVNLDEDDFENAIKASKRGLQLLEQLELDLAKSLAKTRISLQVVLATALVHYFSPKHHPEATRILDQVLRFSPDNAMGLMAKAFVLQAALDWTDAVATFDRVASLLKENTATNLRAQEEAAWCRHQLGRDEDALVGLQNVLDLMLTARGESDDSDIARCLWRIGKMTLERDASASQFAYKHFINALKKDPEFAPAFTSLGIYYLEHVSPPDPVRSSKCFQKAFELDARENVAARRLAEGFADDKEWDLVEVVAQRTIDGEGGLNAGLDKSELDATTRYLPTNSWAWKAIGVVKANYKDYPAAIQAFQIFLRVHPEDQSIWVRLGEAYGKAGRHAAAMKALNRGLDLDPHDWICLYFIADVKHQVAQYDEAIDLLNIIRDKHPEEAGPFALLCQCYLDLGRSYVDDGFQIRAEEVFTRAIKVGLDIMDQVAGFRSLAWKMIGDASSNLSRFTAFVHQEGLRLLMKQINFLPPPDWANDILKIISVPSFAADGPSQRLLVSSATIHCYISRLSLASPNQAINAGAWHDLGIALQWWKGQASGIANGIAEISDQTTKAIKKAIQADPGNDIYWVALGNLLFVEHAKASQHAYIKALEIDSKNAATWVNLGFLYYYHGDTELANEALYRAQVLDPDNTGAWVGQYLIAKANNDIADATLLLNHAVGLAKPVPAADYQFAFEVFEKNQSADSLLSAFFVLNRHVLSTPQDASALHLLSLVCEKLGQHAFGQEAVERAISILEAAYEETEDAEVEMRYIIANCTLGRLRMSQSDYTGAIASFESALGLLEDKDESETRNTVLKVQVRLGLGLANFFRGDLEPALGFLEEGLQVSGDNTQLRGHIVIILAQTLWAIGTDETTDVAKSRLLECITSDPENLVAINILAGMGVLTGDDGLVDAALSEILALPVDRRLTLDPSRDVDYLLIQHNLSQGNAKQAISIAQRAVQTEPSQIEQRNRLASLLMTDGERQGGMALLPALDTSSTSTSITGSSTIPLGQAKEVDALTTSLNIQAAMLAANSSSRESIQEALCKAQRAIMMRPANSKNWETLAFVLSRT